MNKTIRQWSVRSSKVISSLQWHDCDMLWHVVLATSTQAAEKHSVFSPKKRTGITRESGCHNSKIPLLFWLQRLYGHFRPSGSTISPGHTGQTASYPKFVRLHSKQRSSSAASGFFSSFFFFLPSWFLKHKEWFKTKVHEQNLKCTGKVQENTTPIQQVKSQSLWYCPCSCLFLLPFLCLLPLLCPHSCLCLPCPCLLPCPFPSPFLSPFNQISGFEMLHLDSEISQLGNQLECFPQCLGVLSLAFPFWCYWRTLPNKKCFKWLWIFEYRESGGPVADCRSWACGMPDWAKHRLFSWTRKEWRIWGKGKATWELLAEQGMLVKSQAAILVIGILWG